MQQFIVPQFIDVEDKVIGPITTRQFVILLAGFLIIAVSYKLFDFSLFVTFGLFILAITGIFAFLKINGRPFHYFILNLFQTFKKPKLRVWFEDSREFEAETGVEKAVLVPPARSAAEKHHTSSRLAELSLMVDTKGAYRGETSGAANIEKINDVKL